MERKLDSYIFLVEQSLRKIDLPCLNEVQSSETIAFSTYPIWFAVSPTHHLYKVLSSLIIPNIDYNDNGF
jgi:hypothetical protein